MKKTFAALLMSALCCGILSAEEVVTTYDFATAPTLKSTVEPIQDAKEKMLSVTLPLKAPTDGKSFSVEADLDIKKFNHYGALTFGVVNAKKQKVEFIFSKGDDRVNRCRFALQALPGLTTEVKPFDNLKAGKQRISIAYNAPQHLLTLSLLDPDGKELFTTGALHFSGKLNFTDFFIGVLQNDDEASEISYDASAAALFFRSYVGVEGEYPYVIEGSLDNLVLNAEK